MSTTFSSASGAATTPTTAKDRVPRHPTQEDLATAALLQNFNQSSERFDTSSQSARRQSERPPERERDSSAEDTQITRSPNVSEYHSLDDAVSYPRNMERSPQSSSEQRFGGPSQIPNVPSAGQICRYVIFFYLITGKRTSLSTPFSDVPFCRALAEVKTDQVPLPSSTRVFQILTTAATVEQHGHHYGDVPQLERLSAMLADCITKRETKCDQRI